MKAGDIVVDRRTNKPQTVRRVVDYSLHRVLMKPHLNGAKPRQEDMSTNITLVILGGGGCWELGKLQKRFLA